VNLAFTDLNWVAVIAAAVVGIVIGFVWYMPQVFGRRWAAAVGRDLPAPGDVSPTVYVGSVVQALIVAYVLALFINGLGGASLTDGLVVGFLAWLGFFATGAFNTVLFEGRKLEYWLINAGFALVSTVAMGAVIGSLGA
jgi:hypothetical protein